VSRSLALPRFLLLLLAVFSAAAIVLAAIGLYGVLSYAVGLRRPEVGVRVALGARPADIRRLSLGEGILLAGVGVLAGAIGALGLARLLSGVVSGLLFEVSPTDPAAYATVAAVLGVAAFLAAWLPARRASRVDPVVALRSEYPTARAYSSSREGSPKPGRSVSRTVPARKSLPARRNVAFTVYTPAILNSCSAVKRRSILVVPAWKGPQSFSWTLLPPSSQSHSISGQ
jgi:hypothetical protein